MESLLQVSDSSDDSDNEGLEQITTGTAVPAAAAVAATIQPPPVAAPPPVRPPPVATGAPTSQSELSSRLKSLYSPANKATQQTAPSAARPVQQQQQQQQPSQPSASSGFRPLVPNSRLPPPPQQQQHQQQTSRSQSSSSSAGPPDAFEPTPLKTMIERQQQKQAAKQQQHQQQTTNPPSSSSSVQQAPPLRSSGASTSSTASASSASTTVASNISNSLDPAAALRARQEREAKARKEKFLMFTRVLMKYLEQKDPDMHLKAKSVIRECAQKNKAKEKGYESVTASMQTRLRSMVGENYWTRAEQYLEHFLKQKKKIETKKGTSSSSSSSQSQQQQQQQQQQSRTSTSSSSSNKSAEQVAKERQMQAFQQQKLAELKRDQENIRQKQELQKRQAAAEKLRLEQKRKQQQEQMARLAAKQAAEQVAKKNKQASSSSSGGNKQTKSSVSMSSMSASSIAKAAAASAAAAAARASPMMHPTTKGVDAAAASSREYNELMQLVDHAVDYDWTSAALLLGREAKTDVNLNTEQKRLLYGNRLVPPVQTVARGMEAEGAVSELPESMKGWASRNVLSSRGAWARLRLREQREQLKQGGTLQPPVVGGLQLPVAPQTTTTTTTSAVTLEAQWFNEDRAEQDTTLALISEATQIYLKSIVQKSIVAARQRENLDGIRLWHLQHGPSKPPMSLRLGCDVNRQVAQAQGNAAKTVQRMEEALARQKVPAKARQLDNEETLYNATSMSDLALRPELANAAEEAENNAKRSFQVYGGKEATESAPFGRLSKRPKITAKDFVVAKDWSNYSHQRKGIATPQIT